MMKKKKFALINGDCDKNMTLHVAFEGIDHGDLVLCSLSEESVVDLVKRSNYGVLPYDFNIDIAVKEYINKKYDSPVLQND